MLTIHTQSKPPRTHTPHTHTLLFSLRFFATQAFSSVACAASYFVTGTTCGRVHIFTWDGAFIVSMPPLDAEARAATGAAAPILHLGIVPSLACSVLVGDAHGRVSCWDWRSGHTMWVAQPSRPEPVASLVAYPDFGWGGGTVFLSTARGALLRRDVVAGGKSFSDTVLYGPRGRRSGREVRPRLRHLCLDAHEKLLYCSNQGQVLAFCLNRTRLIGRFNLGNSDGTVDKETEVQHPAETGSVVHVAVCLQWLLIAYSDEILAFNRYRFRSGPFTLQHRIAFDTRIASVTALSNFVTVVCQPRSSSGTPDDSGGGEPAVYVFEPDSMRLRDICKLPENNGHILAVGSAHVQMEGGDEASSQHASTHCIVLSNRLSLLRVLTAAELILWLVDHKQFPQAVHLCQQRYVRERCVVEVGNLHACELWRQRQEKQALAVWAELVLPSAPAAYWHVFMHRLAEADKLDLAVKWLPFNDRTKISPRVYEALLLSPLKKGDDRCLLARVARWPVLYSIDTIIDALLASLPELGLIVEVALRAVALQETTGLGLDDKASTACATRLITLFKLYQFGRRFLEAGQALLLYRAMVYDGAKLTLDGWLTADDPSYEKALAAALLEMDQLQPVTYFRQHDIWQHLWETIVPLSPSTPTTAMEQEEGVNEIGLGLDEVTPTQSAVGDVGDTENALLLSVSEASFDKFTSDTSCERASESFSSIDEHPLPREQGLPGLPSHSPLSLALPSPIRFEQKSPGHRSRLNSERSIASLACESDAFYTPQSALRTSDNGTPRVTPFSSRKRLFGGTNEDKSNNVIIPLAPLAEDRRRLLLATIISLDQERALEFLKANGETAEDRRSKAIAVLATDEAFAPVAALFSDGSNP